jgi:mono/diheme cytochrome c family protein
MKATRIAPCVIAVAMCTATAACGDWPWTHDMANQPSRSIGSTTRAAAPGALTVSGETSMTRERAEQVLVTPVPPDAPVDRGRTLYATYCVPCHGEDGSGHARLSEYFGNVPDLGAPDVQQHADGWLFATITNGTARMPRYAHELTPEERWQVVHLLRAMAPKAEGGP